MHPAAEQVTCACSRRPKPSACGALRGALTVEMEAAALYAFAAVGDAPVVCFAHVTNAMGQSEGDFEKGEADGTTASLRVVAATVRAWAKREPQGHPFGNP